jgi:hypothetical protein
VPLEVPQSERLRTMKRVKGQLPEPLPGQWWVEQSKDEPTKRPSSKQRRPLPNNNSSKKLKQRPHTNKVSTHLSDHSLHVWTLADTQLNNNLV